MPVILDIETSPVDPSKPDDALIPFKNKIDLIGFLGPLAKKITIFKTVEEFNPHSNNVMLQHIIGHNLKFDLKTLYFHKAIISVDQYYADTLLMAVASINKIPDSWLEQYDEKRVELNKSLPKGSKHYKNRGKHSLKTLAPYFLDVAPFWENPNTTNDEEYLKKDLEYTEKLYEYFLKELQEQGTYGFYMEKLMPWARIILEAELQGIHIRQDTMAEMWRKAEAGVISSEKKLKEAWSKVEEQYLFEQKNTIEADYRVMEEKAVAKIKETISKQLPKKKPESEAKRLRENDERILAAHNRYQDLKKKSIEAQAPFNYASPTQLLWAMKDVLKYDVTDFSGEEGTGADVLLKLKAEGKEDVGALLDYREHYKLAHSYFPSYKELLHKNRIHCDFNLHGTKTGRLSCSSPNLQQIPPALKEMFCAAPGNKLVSLDLSAIEPKLIAYYSEDETLCKIMINKEDFHGFAAVFLFDLKYPASEVKKRDPDLRQAAKVADLSLFYGTGYKKLWSSLKLHGLSYTPEECKTMRTRYNNKFKGVAVFKENLDNQCYQGNVITNLAGRQFVIDSVDDVYMTAFNRLIQSSGSDILMLAVQKTKEQLKDKAQLRLLVHDNAVFECANKDAQIVYDTLYKHMTNFKLETQWGLIPLDAEGAIGDTWTK